MKVSFFIIPVLIVGLTIAGLNGTSLFRIPSAELVIKEDDPEIETMRAVFIIDGVACRDLALTAMGNLSGLDGVYRGIAYASYNRIDVVYDPGLIDLAAIYEAFEDPVFVEDTGEFVFNMFKVLEVNGKRIEAGASTFKEDGL
jgi:hypothetical protein